MDVGSFANKFQAAQRLETEMANDAKHAEEQLARTRMVSVGAAAALTRATRALAAAEKEVAQNSKKGSIANFLQGFENTKTGRNGNWLKDLANNFQRLAGGLKGMWGNASGTSGLLGAAGTTGVGGIAIVGGLAIVLGQLASVVSALGGGLTAATLGLGALGAVAMPTITGLQSALTGLATATTNYQTASANLNTAIHKSPADWAAYQKTIHGLEPDFQRAAKLLTNQDAAWQSLSPSMRKSLTALRNNAAAYKGLLPDQQKALNALLAQRDAWNSLTPAQQKAAVALQAVGAAWTKVTDAMQPIVLSLVVKGANIAKDLIPFVKPLAMAGAGGLSTLLSQFGKFAKSKDFAAFMKEMSQIAGPAIIALGHGIGQIVIALGKFFTVLGKKDTIMMFTGTIRFVTNVITGLIIALGFLARMAQANAIMLGHIGHSIRIVFDAVRRFLAQWGHDIAHNFDGMRHEVARIWQMLGHDIMHYWNVAAAWVIGSVIKTGHSIESNWNHAWTVVVNYVKGVPGAILRALGNLGSLLINAGKAVMGGFLSGIRTGWNEVTGFLGSVGGWIAHLKGPLDYDRKLLVPHGKAIMDGLMAGIASRMPALHSQIQGISMMIRGGTGGSGGPAWTGSHPFIAARVAKPPNHNTGQNYGYGPMVVESHVYIDSREVYSAVQKRAVRRQKRSGNNGLQRMIR
jgi:phage-related protein